jgi:hypothetical protein
MGKYRLKTRRRLAFAPVHLFPEAMDGCDRSFIISRPLPDQQNTQCRAAKPTAGWFSGNAGLKYRLTRQDYLTADPDYLIADPDYLTADPDYLTADPDYLTADAS